MQWRLRQLDDTAADIRERRLNIDRSGGAQSRRGADDAIGRKKDIGEDVDVTAGSTEGIGADLTIVQNNKIKRLSPGANRDVAS